MKNGFILAIDQGTSSSRVFAVNADGQVIASAKRDHKQIYPRSSWVEHDAAEIWSNIKLLLGEALKKTGLSAKDCAGIGITNQRETVVAWDSKNGQPVYNAIVWQCRRTAPEISRLKNEGLEKIFREKTGLVLDPYFSGSKISWLLNNIPEAKKLSDSQYLRVGTIDSWLLWNLSGGKKFHTDFSNASRTLIFNIQDKIWDQDLLRILNIPEHILPQAKPMIGDFGHTIGLQDIGLIDGIPILAMAGDQQSALFGQGCFETGQAKNTYGTGAFFLVNLGNNFFLSQNGLLTSLGADRQGNPVYVLEGSVFIAGMVMKWLRDNIGLLSNVADSNEISSNISSRQRDVYFVPSFVGLGSPHWQADARGAILGLNLNSGPADIIRAALDSIAFQSEDLLSLIQKEIPEIAANMTRVKADGGASQNPYLMQFQADLFELEVAIPENIETTVLGAAFMAGTGAGILNANKIDNFNPVEKSYIPSMAKEQRAHILQNWRKAVESVKIFI